jgi:hypothetical protein
MIFVSDRLLLCKVPFARAAGDFLYGGGLLYLIRGL